MVGLIILGRALSGARSGAVFIERQFNTWCFRKLAQHRQLCFRHKLCLTLAVAELGFSYHLGSPKAVFVVLFLCFLSCPSTSLCLISFLLFCCLTTSYCIRRLMRLELSHRQTHVPSRIWRSRSALVVDRYQDSLMDTERFGITLWLMHWYSTNI